MARTSLYVRLAGEQKDISCNPKQAGSPVQSSRMPSRISLIAGMLLVAALTAVSVAITNGSTSHSADTPLEALNETPSEPRAHGGPAYNVKKVDWSALRSELKSLVSECQCGPVPMPSPHGTHRVTAPHSGVATAQLALMTPRSWQPQCIALTAAPRVRRVSDPRAARLARLRHLQRLRQHRRLAWCAALRRGRVNGPSQRRPRHCPRVP